MTIEALFAQERDKARRFLCRKYGISTSNADDIISDAFLQLHDNITSGTYVDMNVPLSAYFLGVCSIKALEFMRKNGHAVPIDDGMETEPVFSHRRVEEILAIDADDQDASDRKRSLVRYIVSHMPPPCNRLLWYSYALGYDMTTLLSMFNYKNAHTLIQTRSRCVSRFRERFKQLYNKIFNA